MKPSVSTGERQGYATAMAGVWSGLAQTLGRLEAAAGRPDEYLADDHVQDALPALQYSLHTAAELVLGIVPPPGSEWAHAELAQALAAARDATAEVVAAVETGGSDAAAALVPEWRGALFRVRLARMRLTSAPRPPAPAVPRREPRPHATGGAAVATLLVVLGTFLVTLGAVISAWPMWSAGLALVGGGMLVYRP